MLHVVHLDLLRATTGMPAGLRQENPHSAHLWALAEARREARRQRHARLAGLLRRLVARRPDRTGAPGGARPAAV